MTRTNPGRKTATLAAVLLLLLAPTSYDGAAHGAPAREKPPAAAAAPQARGATWPVARFVGVNTLAVARLEVAEADGKALADWELRALDAAPVQDEALSAGTRAQVVELLKHVTRWAAEFRAAGGRRIYAVLDARSLDDGSVIIVPLEPGVDEKKMLALFGTGRADGKQPPPGGGGGAPAVKMHGAIAWGERDSLVTLRNSQAAPRPELDEALDAAAKASPGARLHVALAPPAGVRAQVLEVAPQLPPPLDKSAGAAARGVQWAALAVTLPPESSMTLTVQGKDAEAAGAAADFISQAVALLKDSEMADSVPEVAGLARVVNPRVAGRRVTVALDRKAVDEVLGPFVAASTLRAHEQALLIRSMTNLRQIGIACYTYAEQHDGQWPADLSQLESYLGGKAAAARVLTNPRRPDKGPAGYVYVRPAGSVADTSADLLVAYEAHDEFGRGVSVLFGDGHCEWVSEESRFKRLVEEAEAAAKRQ